MGLGIMILCGVVIILVTIMVIWAMYELQKK